MPAAINKNIEIMHIEPTAIIVAKIMFVLFIALPSLSSESSEHKVEE